MSRLLPRFTVSSHADQLKIDKIVGTKPATDIVAWQDCPTSTTRSRQQRQPISRELRGWIIERDRAECYLCGRECDETEIHIDHVIPVSKGGDNHPTNLRVTCASCNLRKSNRLLNSAPPIAIRAIKRRPQTSSTWIGADPLRALLDKEHQANRKSRRR